MGMEVRLTLADVDQATAARAAVAAFALIADLEDRLSDYRPHADVLAIARAAPEAVIVHPEVWAVLTRAVEVARASHGAFDPTVGPLVTVWREARLVPRLPDPATLDAARSLVDWSRLVLDPAARSARLPVVGMRLDTGGIAKGYILQRARDVLRAHGVAAALVEAGGDLVAGDAPRGTPGWVVQASCGDPRRVLVHSAFATSGASVQFVEIDGTRYSHIVDPRTGLGVTSPHLVHVQAPDAATADAWATALSVLGPAGADTVTVPTDVVYCFG